MGKEKDTSKAKSKSKKEKKKKPISKKEVQSSPKKGKKISVSTDLPEKVWKFVSQKKVYLSLLYVLLFVVGLLIVDFGFQYWDKKLSIAIVNGERISREKYYKHLEGHELPDYGTTAGLFVSEQLVSDALILQEARGKEYDVEEDVKSRYEQTLANFESDEELRETLKIFPQFEDIEGLRESFRKEAIIRAYVRDYFEEKLTEEDLKSYYEMKKEELEATAEEGESSEFKYEDVKEQLKEEFFNQSYPYIYNEVVYELMNEGEIVNNYGETFEYKFFGATLNSLKNFWESIRPEEEIDTDEAGNEGNEEDGGKEEVIEKEVEENEE